MHESRTPERRRRLSSFLQSTQTRLLSFLATTYLRAVGLTSRIEWHHRSVREEMEASGRGFIYAFWHGRQVFLTYLHQRDRLHPLISKSRDGEFIAQVCRSFGLDPVRGSSSRGGVEAVLGMKAVLDQGDRVSVTPDGPRGPRAQVQPGVLYLAQKTGLPIVPVAYGAKRRWVFGGWDEFVVPKPFNRIAMVYGSPVRVEPGDDLTAKAQELKMALDTVTQKADQAAGSSQ